MQIKISNEPMLKIKPSWKYNKKKKKKKKKERKNS